MRSGRFFPYPPERFGTIKEFQAFLANKPHHPLGMVKNHHKVSPQRKFGRMVAGGNPARSQTLSGWLWDLLHFHHRFAPINLGLIRPSVSRSTSLQAFAERGPSTVAGLISAILKTRGLPLSPPEHKQEGRLKKGLPMSGSKDFSSFFHDSPPPRTFFPMNLKGITGLPPLDLAVRQLSEPSPCRVLNQIPLRIFFRLYAPHPGRGG